MEVTVKGVDGSVLEKLQKLRDSTSEDKKLYSNLDKAFEKLMISPFYGNRVQKKRIPKYFLEKYKMDNLLIYDLPGAWRLLYSIERYQDTILVIVIDFMSHTEYDRLFSYSRK